MAQVDCIHKGWGFSRDGFVTTIRFLYESGYLFRTFSEIIRESSDSEKVCILRHDVDVSVHLAFEMARIEHELGIRSTYFLMLRSPTYNLFTRTNTRAIKHIQTLGHEIGLHFDGAAPTFHGNSIEQQILSEMGILSSLIGTDVRAFSFHQPTAEDLSMSIEPRGVINAYRSTALSDFQYISDSNRNWKGRDPRTMVDSGTQKLQILIHPIWWMCESSLTTGCWDEAIARNFYAEQVQIVETERAYGKPRRIDLTT